ncbi:hypothetical protein RHMOL_Rhmol11G0129200 [Rhododendron molle]|uniref:Uncharacterized protein n=1 Tax=Rhododendron molle TaxID=49168 RepID=A0ACC0LT95_RHOML|nr:hypothetical protein RHMOL_Rhmol11G0129200 [Rhododendron molle]
MSESRSLLGLGPSSPHSLLGLPLKNAHGFQSLKPTSLRFSPTLCSIKGVPHPNPPSINRWSLDGATALVTGGTRGIGRAVVAELAGLEATVHTCARNGTELDKCLRGWEEEGLRVSGSVCDVSFRFPKHIPSLFLQIIRNNVVWNSQEERQVIFLLSLDNTHHRKVIKTTFYIRERR